jgi:hypothetical protein
MRTFPPTVAQSMHEKAALKKDATGQRRYWASRRIGQVVSRECEMVGRLPREKPRPHAQSGPRNGEATRKYGSIAGLRLLVWHRHPRSRHPVTGRCQNPAA